MHFVYLMVIGGNIFILFGPHIGISDYGLLGKYTRRHQHHDGSACGAAVGALKYCTDGKHIPTASELGENCYDFEMQYIISEISKKFRSINGYMTENARQHALVMEMYNIIKVS